MREVIITQILYGFDHKTDFEGCSWFKFNDWRLVLGMAMIFYRSVAKGFKLKVRSQKVLRETSRRPLYIPPPPILYRFKNELTDSRLVKTIKKEKYRFHCFIACSVEEPSIVNVIILKICSGTLQSAVFTYGEIGKGKLCCWDSVCKCWTSASVRYKIIIIRKSRSNNIILVEQRWMNMSALSIQ